MVSYFNVAHATSQLELEVMRRLAGHASWPVEKTVAVLVEPVEGTNVGFYECGCPNECIYSFMCFSAVRSQCECMCVRWVQGQSVFGV